IAIIPKRIDKAGCNILYTAFLYEENFLFGAYLGDVSGALITIMHNRKAAESKRGSRLKHRIGKIRNQIINN
ncbi:MAG: hypothetical protein PVG44_15850, partial [Desulfobacterales bacterium]